MMHTASLAARVAVDLMARGYRASELQPQVQIAPSIQKAIDKGFVIGAKVVFNHMDHTGEIVGYNRSSGGLLSMCSDGERCPVLVKRDDGETFEYSLDCIRLAKAQ